MTKLLLIALVTVPLLSYMGSKRVLNSVKIDKKQVMFDFARSTPKDLINLLKNPDNRRAKLNQIMFNNKAPVNWIKKSDLEFLMPLIHSSDTSKCFVSVLSSQACFSNCSATLGGHAIEMIACYRKKVQFPHSFYNCPQADAQKVKEIQEWRKTNWH